MSYLVPIIASLAAAGLCLRTRTIWLLVIACLFANPLTVQWWGLFHYVLGARYFNDMGYGGLYECSAAATGTATRRDLATYDFRFDDPYCDMPPPRAARLVDDLNQFNFEKGMLTDKGLNATPAWLAVFTPLAALPVWQLIIIDPLALAAAVFIVIRLVGGRKAAYACLFVLAFYGTFGRLWGHYAQWIWLALSIVGVALLQKRRYWGAGLIGLAAGLQVFPVFLILMISKQGRPWFIAGLGLMLAIGLFNPRGLQGYTEFVQNMALHSAYVRSEPYNIGLTNTLTMILNPETQADYRQCFTVGDCVSRYEYSGPGAIWLLMIPLVGWTWAGLMFGAVTLSRYYYLILAVIALENERQCRALLGLNAILMTWYLLDWNSIYVYGHLLWILFFGYWGLEKIKCYSAICCATFSRVRCGPRPRGITDQK